MKRGGTSARTTFSSGPKHLANTPLTSTFMSNVKIVFFVQTQLQLIYVDELFLDTTTKLRLDTNPRFLFSAHVTIPWKLEEL